MRILHCIYDHVENPWVGGGGAHRVREIYRRLAERHDVTVVCGKYPGARDYVEGDLGYRFVGTDNNNYALSTFSYAFEAAKWLRRHKNEADVIVEDFAPYNPLFSNVMASGRPVVLQVHHREGLNLFKRYFVLGLPFMAIEKFYPRLFRDCICVSEASKQKFGLKEASVISNGISDSLLETDSIDGDYASFVGRLHIHNKGLDTLVKAAAIKRFKASVAGRGRDEAKLREMINGAGLSGRIGLAGYLDEDEKVRFISKSRLFVLPSRYEGQGIVVLEAAACGKPVVVSDIQELSFAVEAGFGISFKAGDHKDLAEKINLLWEDEDARKRMSGRAREFAREHTWGKIATEYEHVLIQVAGHKR